MFRYHIVAYSIIIMILAISPAQAKDDDIDALANLSFSDLSTVVTSVSKRPEESFTAPAAVYVITQQDIQSSGLRSIPEILRMAPGLQVTQTDTDDWSITARGFNAEFGNKLLVLIDGRTVYTPLFSGVYWEAQDTFIDDIERIEVIRGPGGSLWGANAVNGVINIITKSAKETQTNVVNVGYGNGDTRDFIEARNGSNTKSDSSDIFYRAYVKHMNFDASETTLGTNARDGGWKDRGGFRVDVEKSKKDDMTFQGDIYNNHEKLILQLPNNTSRNDIWLVSGGNLLTRWNHHTDDNSKSALQLYIDNAAAAYSPINENINTFDMDYQYDTAINDKNNVIAGAGYRYIWDHLKGSTFISYNPTSLNQSLFSTFIQDTYKIIPDKLHFTLGSKLEHNVFTGFEVEPSARIGWYPSNNHTVWASVSRAVRTPNRSEEDVSIVVAPGYQRWLGNSNLASEEVIAYELGYRIKASSNLLFDATTFLNKYNRLMGNEAEVTNLPTDTTVGLPFVNNGKATTEGFEFASTWDVTRNWQLKGSYTFLVMEMESTNSSMYPTHFTPSGNSPKNQFNLASQLYLPHGIEFSNNFYYVQNLPALDIAGYYRFDTRLMWTVKPGLQISLVGQNLLNGVHQEFSPFVYSAPNEIGRTLYTKITVRF